MPTLNYENAGALVEYDYLQGTITALDTANDTADVSGACGALSAVPIFYHCEPDSVARDNGALTGAAGGFKVGDLVVVLKSSNQASSSLYSLDKIELKGSESTATGPKYFVVGHYDGVVKCEDESFALLYCQRPSYGTVWFIVWDMATDDYAEGVRTTTTHIITKAEYPYNTQNQPDILAGWKTDKFNKLTGIASYVDESINLFIDDDTSFGNAQVGDYVWVTGKPWTWSKIKTVAGGIITTVELVLTNDDLRYTVSAFLSLYPVAIQCATYGIVSYAEGIANGYYDGFPACGNSGNRSWEAEVRRDTTFTDLRDNTVAIRSIGDSAFYSQQLSGTFYKCFGDKISSYKNIIQHGLAINTTRGGTTLFTTDYTEEYYSEESGEVIGMDFFSRLFQATGEAIYSGYGQANPLSQMSWSYTQHIGGGWSGDSIRVSGALAVCNDKRSFQFYTYPGYLRNTVGQCVKRSTPASPPVTTRSSKLEQAILKLIDAVWQQNRPDLATIEVFGYAYSGGRVANAGTMLQCINAARGSDNLREDVELMAACKSLAERNAASGISQHSVDTGQFNEVCSVASDDYSISKVVEGWMASPLHKYAVYGGAFGVFGTTKFGWASGTYPASMETITIGAGLYNNNDGSYSTTPTTVIIPEDLRGRMKFYVVQIAR